MVWNVWYGGELSRWVELLIINVFPEVFFLRKEPLPSVSRLFTPLLKNCSRVILEECMVVL